MKTTLLKLALLLCPFLLAIPAKAQFTIDSIYTAEELVMDFFNTGVLVSVSNITFNGMPADTISPQIKLFNAPSTSLPFESGLCMATGSLTSIYNPIWSPFTAAPADADIQAISTSTAVNDCAVLEFDVLVNADALAFGYSFASLEYASFTCSIFNDAFGLFISGPGIAGPYQNGAINIALIPNSETPVAVNTVNGGLPTGGGSFATCQAANPNWQNDTIYFVNQDLSVSSPTFNQVVSSGNTTALEAWVGVINGETYHMKFAICDVLDGALDSYVFLEAGSFEGRFLSSVAENKGVEPLTIWPNPATDKLTIEFPADLGGNGRIDLRDMQGRVVLAQNTSNINRLELDVQAIPAGIYLVQFTAENGQQFVQKLVVEKR